MKTPSYTRIDKLSILVCLAISSSHWCKRESGTIIRLVPQDTGYNKKEENPIN